MTSMSILSRRSLFPSLATLLGFASHATASALGTSPDAPPAIDPTPVLFEYDGAYIEFDPVGRTICDVPRWEALADDPTPQPAPILTHVGPGLRSASRHIIRDWEPDDVEHCRLCETCGAFPNMARPGRMTCARLAPAGLPPAHAPLFTEGPLADDAALRERSEGCAVEVTDFDSMIRPTPAPVPVPGPATPRRPVKARPVGRALARLTHRPRRPRSIHA